MKKLVLFLLLLTVSQNGQAQITGAWLAVDSKQVTTNFISPINGTIFHFKDDILKIRNVFSDTTIQYQYQLVNNAIFIEDSLFASVKHLSADSLKLQFGEWMSTIFFPLKLNATSNQLNQDFLVGNSWILEEQEWNESIYFFEGPQELHEYGSSKQCLIRRPGISRGGEVGRWHLFQVEGAQFLALSYSRFRPFDLVVYNINAFNGTEVAMSRITSLRNNSSTLLSKQPRKSPAEIGKVKNLLCAKKWKSKELLDLQTSNSMNDSLWIDLGATGFYLRDTILITEKELKNNKIAFSFKDDNTYTIYTSKVSIASGKWQLINDGEIIYINTGSVPEDYYNIISISKNELVIASSDQFTLEKGSRDWVRYYYTLKLK